MPDEERYSDSFFNSAGGCLRYWLCVIESSLLGSSAKLHLLTLPRLPSSDLRTGTSPTHRRRFICYAVGLPLFLNMDLAGLVKQLYSVRLEKARVVSSWIMITLSSRRETSTSWSNTSLVAVNLMQKLLRRLLRSFVPRMPSPLNMLVNDVMKTFMYELRSNVAGRMVQSLL
jgi:hypothetical protein